VSRSERNPKWLDRFQYPFCLNVFHSSSGAIHYVDEGKGKPIVFVHGSPEWSFAYRAQIKAFSSTHRCIAIDHLGFGLSDKPRRWSYLPEDQAKNFSNLMDYLDLKDVTLVVNDWGGPIGLSYAVANSSRIKQIILINTWFWSIGGDSYRKFFNQLAGSRLARVLIVKSGYLTKLFLSKAYLID
jgi:pimeloyl-ACP methyl ester carboxylesterase